MVSSRQSDASAKSLALVIAGVLTLGGLYLISRHNYLLFHSLAEVFSIVVAGAIFMVFWNARRFLDSGFYLFIGIAYAFVAGLDLTHTLGYTGMNVFPGYDTNLPAQLWIASRYLESLSLFAAPFFFRRRLKPSPVFAVYTTAVILLLGSIFFWNIFPDCFVEGAGLTPFKKISEYIICLILVAAIVRLWPRRAELDARVFHLLIASITVTIVSELSFTLYIDAYGLPNMVGHLLKIVSFYLMYKAFIEAGIARPFGLMFREIKQSEEALLRERDYCRSVVDTAQVIVLVLDLEGRIVSINPYLQEISGYSLEEVQGKDWFTTFLPERDRNRIQQLFKGGAASDSAIRGNVNPIVTKDGQEREIEWHDDKLRDADGNIIGVVAIGHDITERMRAESQTEATAEALRESEERFRSIYSQSPIAIELYGADGCLISVNPACLHLFGVADVEAVKGFRLFEDPNLPEDARERLLAGEPVSYEAEFDFELVKEMGLYETTRSGQYYVDCLITPWGAGTDEDRGFLVHVRDITERKRVESQRDATLEALRLQSEIAANMSEGVYLVRTSDGVIAWANSRFEELFGYGPAEMVGKHVSIVNAPTDKSPEETAEEIMGILDKTGVWRGEIGNIKKDGTLFWCDASVSVFDHPEHGRVLVAVHLDITERVRAAEEREHLLMLEREQRLLADTLAEATFAVASLTSHEAVLDEILAQAHRIVPYDSANIGLIQGDVLRNVRDRGYDIHGDGDFVAGALVPLTDLPTDAASLRTQRPVVVPDTRQDPRWLAFPETMWIRSYLVAPICLHNRVLGLLRLDSEIPRRFSAEDAERLLPLTNVAAVALENARLYETTLHELGERQAAEEQIRASLREKEVMLKEIHHRVGNNLQIISSLLSMQSRVIEDETAVAAFQESQNRVRSMARIHERLYRSQDLAQIEMQRYLNQLVADLWMTYAPQGITARVEAAGIALDIDKAIPCALLLNELVSNALKHAFPAPVSGQENEVRISMRREAKSIVLTVSDNGVGLPADLDLENIDSLGLDLVRLLTRQIGGILEVDRSGRASFKITFPQP